MSDAADIPAAAAARRPKMRFKHKLFLIILSLLMMGFLRTGFMFVIIGLLPSIVAYYMDVTATRFHFKTIFACNLTGMLPYIERILAHGPSSAVMQSIMGDAQCWFVIYGAALMGWLLVQVCPMIAQFLVVGFSHTRVSHIEHIQKKIENEWGNEVTQFSRAAADAADDD